MSEGKQSEVNAAVRTLIRALKSDPGCWISWKANIAVQFQDTYEQFKGDSIHAISNVAAERFLQLLTREVKQEQDVVKPKDPGWDWDANAV